MLWGSLVWCSTPQRDAATRKLKSPSRDVDSDDLRGAGVEQQADGVVAGTATIVEHYSAVVVSPEAHQLSIARILVEPPLEVLTRRSCGLERTRVDRVIGPIGVDSRAGLRCRVEHDRRVAPNGGVPRGKEGVANRRAHRLLLTLPHADHVGQRGGRRLR